MYDVINSEWQQYKAFGFRCRTAFWWGLNSFMLVFHWHIEALVAVALLFCTTCMLAYFWHVISKENHLRCIGHQPVCRWRTPADDTSIVSRDHRLRIQSTTQHIMLTMNEGSRCLWHRCHSQTRHHSVFTKNSEQQFSFYSANSRWNGMVCMYVCAYVMKWALRVLKSRLLVWEQTADLDGGSREMSKWRPWH